MHFFKRESLQIYKGNKVIVPLHNHLFLPKLCQLLSGTCPKPTAGPTEQRHSVKLNVLCSLTRVDLGKEKGHCKSKGGRWQGTTSEEVTAPGGDKVLQKSY